MHDPLKTDRTISEVVLNIADANIDFTRAVCEAVLRFTSNDARMTTIRAEIDGFLADLDAIQAETDHIRQEWRYLPGTATSRLAH